MRYLILAALLIGCAHKPIPEKPPAPTWEVLRPMAVPEFRGNNSKTNETAASKPTTVHSVYYPVNTDTLAKNQVNMLSRLAATVSMYPTTIVTVSGYSDTTGRAKYNKALSERRANHVLETLLILGVSRDRITAIGFGEIPGPLDNSRKVTIMVK
jgi:outer membrane protein OmpA-like peptidoglycan-associated protein